MAPGGVVGLDGLKLAPGWPKMFQEASKTASKMAPDVPKWVPDGFEMGQESSKTVSISTNSRSTAIGRLLLVLFLITFRTFPLRFKI